MTHEEQPGSHVSPRWAQWRARVDLDEYDRRWEQRAAAGESVHGEVDFVMRWAPTRVLDAGCGTGRVAIELARRGVAVVGVDLDPDLLAVARRRAPQLDWRHADLATIRLGEVFDLVVLAGNVLLFCRPEDRAAIVASLAGHVRPGGLLLSGCTIEAGWGPAELDALAAGAGLEPAGRWCTWEGDPYHPGAGYLLAAFTRPPRTEPRK